MDAYRYIMVTKCAISENTTEYIPVVIGVIGITASLYNYYSQFGVLQSERDVHLLASLGTTALASYMATTILKTIRLSTCNIPISY